MQKGGSVSCIVQASLPVDRNIENYRCIAMEQILQKLDGASLHVHRR